MTNEATDQTGKFDLAPFTDRELEALIPKIEKELVKRKEERKKEALQKMREIAESIGMTPEELLGLKEPRAMKRRRSPGTRPIIQWQHPDDPTQVYQGGKKPAWLKELEAEGRSAVKAD